MGFDPCARLLDAASASVAGIVAPFIKSSYEALVNDGRVGLSPRGCTKKLVQRVYDNRAFIINQLELGIDLLDLDTDPYGGVAGGLCFYDRL